MQTSTTSRRTLLRLAAAATLAAVLPFAAASTATAAGHPQLPRAARGAQPDKPPTKLGHRSGPPRATARLSQLNTVVFGQTQCPTVGPPAATRNSAHITPPLIYGNNGDWFQFWNGFATSTSGWKPILWDGPYWAYGNSLTSPIYNPRTGSWRLSQDGGGTTDVTWPLGTAGLGYQHIVDVSTGQVREGFTRAMNSGITCSTF
jgi:hypothetical protein